MNGPVASNLLLLGDLDQCVPGTKVRFLGCVDEYVVGKATLRLKHHYPDSQAHKTANVDIQHVLETVKRHEIDVGAWINVIGYIERQTEKKGIHVQAVAIWDAGNVDLNAYYKSVAERQNAA